MISPQDVMPKLLKDELYRSWKKQHPQSFCSHFFCSLTAAGIVTSSWEAGFFDPRDSKITVFMLLPSGNFEIKPADDVFKKEDTMVEKLKMEKVNITLDQVLSTLQAQLAASFSQEKMGNGFCILQTLDDEPLWNFTFVTQSLKFANVKINAEHGAAEAQLINVVEKG